MAGREIGQASASALAGLPAAKTVRLRAPDGPVQVRVWPALASPSAVASRSAEGDQSAGAGSHSPADPPTLLAFHGWTDSAEVFAPLATALRGRWPMLAPDAPGHGRTPLRAGPFVIADHVTSALAVLDAVPRLAGSGRRTVVAYGHSMGALTATRLAAARPELVRGLVLEEPARTTMGRSGSSSAGMRTWIRTLLAGDHASRLAWVRANHPTWPEAELEPWAQSKENVDLAHLDRPAEWGEPLPALLSEVHCPVLIIRGEPARGGIVSRTGARRCAAACPGGARVLALDTGHCPRREAPAEFLAALTEVLSSW